MWISKKKWESLEKRVADLEVQVRSQQERRNKVFCQFKEQSIKSFIPERKF